MRLRNSIRFSVRNQLGINNLLTKKTSSDNLAKYSTNDMGR